ncbi:MAG: hypothetical protein AB7F86_10835 [Bdellovibrionales bacterium]
MKIWVHGYELNPVQHSPQKSPRQGALLKVEWALGQVGYSDLHPWPEFGEESLDRHLEALAEMRLSRLIEISLEFNYIDREFRLLRRNAFLGMIIPRSHFLIPNILEVSEDDLRQVYAKGYTHIKVKMGRDWPHEVVKLQQMLRVSNFRWRLDFNGQVSQENLAAWWSDLKADLKVKIDFIEDPVADGHPRIQGPWASDWIQTDGAQIRVMKPAREGVEEAVTTGRVIFTNSLEHTFGQACAAWAAAHYYMQHPKKTEICGLSTENIYERDEFSRAWSSVGPRMRPTPGLGFGFDDLLESCKWERIF